MKQQVKESIIHHTISGFIPATATTESKRYFRYFDWLSFSLIVALTSIGLLFVYSATYKTDQHFSTFFKKQLFGFASGLLIYFAFCWMDYRRLCRIGYFIYFAIMGLLLFTMIKGHMGMGAKRWIDLAFFRFQPSELAKLFFPAFIAHYFETEKKSGVYDFIEFVPVLMVLGVSFLLVLKQPDLGTGLLLLFNGLILLWLLGIPKKFFLIMGLVSITAAPIMWKSLKEYQRKRVMVFLGYGDALKERYHLEQSKIAIGSGGFTGKGFLQGTQNKYLFLPESRTDFIFSVVCEELGFLGAMFVIILFLLLFVRLFLTISTLNTVFAQLLATGLVLNIALAAVINMGMACGLLPIVGIPLPFLSYGLTHIWSTFAGLGWVNGILIRQRYQTGP